MRRRLAHVAALTLVLLAAISGCEPAEGGRERARNLLLISIDTLRPDHLGTYGYPRPTSPQIDRLAAEGFVFENAWTPSPWTLPAHATMLTGLYPSHHGLKSHDERLRSDVPLLAEILALAGFETAGFVNSQNLRDRYGFHRGFEHFRYHPEQPPRDGPSDVHRSALRFLAHPDRRARRFFLFLHFYDVHSDYRSLPRYRAAFAPPGDHRADGTTAQMQAFRRGKAALDASDADRLRDLYDAGIRQMDDGLGRIREVLERQELLDSTLIIVTSDHGEEFFDHGSVLHGRTHYAEVARVPWVMRGPGVPRGGRSDVRVSLVDVVPTALSMLGVDALAGLDGLDASHLIGDDPDVARFRERLLFGEADHGNEAHDVKRAVWDEHFAYLLDLHSGQRELYDRRSDPREQRDLAADRPDVVGRLQSALDRFAESERRGEAIEPLAPEDVEALKALGYLE